MRLVNLKLYLLFVAVVTGVMGNMPEKIVSGQYSSPTELPYIASLRTNHFHFCGGSIISNYHILTAAHCVYQNNPQGSPYKPGLSYVITGTTMRKYNGTLHKIKSCHPHPYFRMDPVYKLKYDIAIITVDKKIEMNEHQKIIRLPVSHLPARSAGTAAGWGDLYFKQQLGSDILLKLETTVMNGEECYKYRPYDHDTKSIVCSLVESGLRGGTCQGDSGGPLRVDNFVVGIVSNGAACASGVPDVFTSVFFYKPWIEQIISQSGVAGVTKDTPKSDFYDKDLVKKLSLKYVRASQFSPYASQIAYYSYFNGEWYAVLH